jgi:hypothetical protein
LTITDPLGAKRGLRGDAGHASGRY